jgi:AraC-like DNA-binding protein
MISWAVEEKASAPCLTRRPQLTRLGIPFGPSFTAIPNAHSALANIVDEIADWDICDASTARGLAIRVLPGTTPHLVVQYRTPVGSSRTFGCSRYQHEPYRHVVTRVQSGVVTIRPEGPLGVIIVQLRPEGAVRLLGGSLQNFADTKIKLGDIFRDRDVSALEEMVSEAPDSRARCAHVLRFLSVNIVQRESDLIACRAAALLRRIPTLRMRRLAEKLDISERHLCRRFHMTLGTSPKQFARLVRIEKALTARNSGLAWAHTAYACGFADQAHMIRDFNAIAGAAPEDVFCLSSVKGRV